MLFFFSSRSRHTRWTGDWSSDVCSSDLIERTRQLLDEQRREAERHIADQYFAAVHREDLVKKAFAEQEKQANASAQAAVERSEERRVGKVSTSGTSVSCLSY